MGLTNIIGLSTSPIMLVLATVSVFALAVVLERLWAWGHLRGHLKQPIALLDLAHSGQSSEAIATKTRPMTTRNPFARVLLQWSESNGHRGHVEQAICLEEEGMDQNLWILDCSAAIGPLLGILGTIAGISSSFGGFDAIAELSPAVVSQGISLALRSTAVGLIVTIGSVVFACIFRRRTSRAVASMESFGEELLSLKER